MINKISHTSLFVSDQDKAYDFYVNKLGFVVRTDMKMQNGYRWLTVNAPEQPDVELVLLDGLSMVNGQDPEVRDALKVLLDKNALGAGVMHTPDCAATYEELKAKGVQFKCAPREQFYGTEFIMLDGCGNWFSVVQPKETEEVE